MSYTLWMFVAMVIFCSSLLSWSLQRQLKLRLRKVSVIKEVVPGLHMWKDRKHPLPPCPLLLFGVSLFLSLHGSLSCEPTNRRRIEGGGVGGVSQHVRDTGGEKRRVNCMWQRDTESRRSGQPGTKLNKNVFSFFSFSFFFLITCNLFFTAEQIGCQTCAGCEPSGRGRQLEGERLKKKHKNEYGVSQWLDGKEGKIE